MDIRYVVAPNPETRRTSMFQMVRYVPSDRIYIAVASDLKSKAVLIKVTTTNVKGDPLGIWLQRELLEPIGGEK